MGVMVVLVELFAIHPVITQGIAVIFTVIAGYFGHKNYSFKSEKTQNNDSQSDQVQIPAISTSIPDIKK